MMKRLCVYCGSSAGNDPIYTQAAEALGILLAKKSIALVYGGAQVGLMGTMADAVLRSGGEVFGVIPKALVQMEVAHPRLTALHIVETMHERKALMCELSDGFIAFPGGFGTLDELFEILTWSQLQLHQKPIAIYNLNGFFDGLIQFVDHCVNAEFVPQESRTLLKHAHTAESVLEILQTP